MIKISFYYYIIVMLLLLCHLNLYFAFVIAICSLQTCHPYVCVLFSTHFFSFVFLFLIQGAATCRELGECFPEIQFLRHKQYATSALLSHMRTVATVLYLFHLLEIS